MNEKYIKRQLTLFDVGIEINPDIEKYYLFVKERYGDFNSNPSIQVPNAKMVIIAESDAYIDSEVVYNFSETFNVKNINLCRNIIRHIINYILNTNIQEIYGVGDFEKIT